MGQKGSNVVPDGQSVHFMKDHKLPYSEKASDFVVNGQHLNGTLIFPKATKGKSPGVLFVHGLTGHKESSYQYANGLAKIGYVSFLFDMRGHGKSGGDLNILNLNDFLEDVLSAYDHFTGIEFVDKDNISVVGSSMGAYLAARLSSKRDVQNLVIRAPADYPDGVTSKPTVEHGGENPAVMDWRKQPKNYNDSLALRAVHALGGDVLIIESERDDRVPRATVENYANAVKDKTQLTCVVLKDAPHSIKDGKFKDEVERILVNWFSRGFSRSRLGNQ